MNKRILDLFKSKRLVGYPFLVTYRTKKRVKTKELVLVEVEYSDKVSNSHVLFAKRGKLGMLSVKLKNIVSLEPE